LKKDKTIMRKGREEEEKWKTRRGKEKENKKDEGRKK
jgi:hypothetical protein